MRTLVLARLSKVADGVTIQLQQDDCNAWVRGEGGVVVGVAVDDGVSGARSIFDRPATREWFTGAPRFDTVVAHKLDRLSRSMFDTVRLLEWCKNHGVRVVTVKDHLDTRGTGNLTLHIMAAVAENEREMIRARVKASKQARKARGEFLGGHAPLGLRVDGKRLVPATDGTEQVASGMFSAASDGVTMAEISRLFGVPLSSVPQTLGNVAYVDSGLIEPSVFTTAQRRRVTGPRRRSDSPLLAGVVKCATCGKGMHGKRTVNGSGKAYAHYAPARGCTHPPKVQQHLVHAEVTDFILHLHGEDEYGERQWVEGDTHARDRELLTLKLDAAMKALQRAQTPAEVTVADGYVETLQSRLRALPDPSEGSEGEWVWQGRGITVQEHMQAHPDSLGNVARNMRLCAFIHPDGTVAVVPDWEVGHGHPFDFYQA